LFSSIALRLAVTAAAASAEHFGIKMTKYFLSTASRCLVNLCMLSRDLILAFAYVLVATVWS